MEDILEVYARPYDPRWPVVCMDETNKQLIGEVRQPLPVAPGRPARVEHEYVRNGVAQVFLEVEPLSGQRHVEAGERRTRRDWALWIQGMLETRYPQAQRLEIHYTPKHGSWLNMAEIELSALCGQCLNRRIPDLERMQQEIAAWEADRNQQRPKINWHFRTPDARIKLESLYPPV